MSLALNNWAQSFLSESFQFLEVKFSMYLNRRVFVMKLLHGDKNNWSDCTDAQPNFSLCWAHMSEGKFSGNAVHMTEALNKMMKMPFSSRFPTLDIHRSGPSCSKLTMSLVNDSFKFTSNYNKYAEFFCWKKKSYSHFFSKKISEYCILNPLKQLTKWPLTSL